MRIDEFIKNPTKIAFNIEYDHDSVPYFTNKDLLGHFICIRNNLEIFNPGM